MKAKSIILLLSLAVASFFIGGCTIETSDNGKLDGFWHLVGIDTVDTGGTTDLAYKYRYWGVNFNLLYLQDYPENEAGRFYLRFSRTNSSLRVYEPRSGASGESAGETLDTLLASPLPLQPYGINSLDVTFNIEKLSSSRMILNDGTLRLHFKKM